MLTCPICSKNIMLLDLLDLDKDCQGLNLLTGKNKVEYYVCTTCGFCFAPKLYNWTTKEFADNIYNDDYIRIDPDYISLRPINNAKLLQHTFRNKALIRHLDYGGGGGLLSKLLAEDKWNSSTHDPYVLGNEPTGKYNLITAFEVFEHSNNPQDLMQQISKLLSTKGILLFSTVLSDNQLKQPLTWWYAAPRNGHISLFSRRSLRELAKQWGFNLVSFSSGIHAMWKKMPTWAEHLIKP